MNKLIQILLFGIFSSNYLQSEIVLDRFTEDKYKPIVFLGIGGNFGHNADEFIKLYELGFGGNKQEFSNTPNFSIQFKTWLSQKMRTGVSLNYSKIEYFDEFWTVGRYITRNHTNELSFKRLPIIIKFEFIPYDKQFRSYAGVGFGAMLQQIKWHETIRSTFELDKRRSATHFDEFEVSPCVNIYSGLELGFDEYPESYFLGSLIFEIDYSYFPKKIDIFRKARQVLDVPNSALNKEVSIFENYFSFTVGISFNLLNITK
jgi:hypothetical protein